MRKKNKTSTTTAQTDQESGQEGLGDQEEKRREIQALQSMYDRGLIPEVDYQARLKDLTSN